MALSRHGTRDDSCLERLRPELKGLYDHCDPEFEFGVAEEIGEDELGILWEGRDREMETCMEIDFSRMFSIERRRNGSRLLGRCSVGQQLMERGVALWRKTKKKMPRGPKGCCWLLMVNAAVMALTFVTGIITYESSVDTLRQSLETTVLFPIYLPHAVALSVVGKLKLQAFLGIFLGLYASRIYAAARSSHLISFTRAGVLLATAVLGTAEVYSANCFLYRQLMKEGSGKKLPTIENIKEALKYVGTVVVCTLIFETVITLVICSSTLVMWSDFYRFWGTSWLGVLSGMLTITPTITHMLAWQPKPSLLRPKKLLEAVALTVVTGTLVIIIFVTNVLTVIYPLPYLLFPIIILTAFRFNRLGCSLVVMIISYICTWASVRGKGALYRMAGRPQPVSSPKLILQIELFVSVLGLVGILLAAAVREKKQLARDLHRMNEELESTVSERTIELVKANEALKESQRKAELASQAKSDFLANMSHEIRTPIHGIMGLTSLVLDSELSNDQRESLLSVQDCANVLLHIINSILDLAKIEAGRIEVEFVTFTVSQLVNRTVRMLHTRAMAKNLDLVWDIDPSVPQWLVGDFGKVQQCLLNLIGNAVKFTHEGSVRVHVRVDKSGGTGRRPSARRTADEQDRSDSASPPAPTLKPDSSVSSASVFDSPVEWQCCNPDNLSTTSRKSPNVVIRSKDSLFCVPVIFEVHDTGIGVSPEKLHYIFTPFTQADASTSRVYGGTGLGLCIVQRFVELLGGKLHAKSELGKGSCFSFCVPMGYSPKNCDRKACERNTVNLVNILSSFIPSEPRDSAGENCCEGNRPPPPPPASARTCVDRGDCCPASSCNDQESFRSVGEPKVRCSQCTLDSVGSRNSSGAMSEVVAWNPIRRTSVEKLDVLLASWNQNDALIKGRECECACSNSTAGHKCCNPLCSAATPQRAQPLDTPQPGANVLELPRVFTSPSSQQGSFSQSGKQSPVVSPLRECNVLIPPSRFPTVDLDSFSILREDSPCVAVETHDPSGIHPQRGGQAPVQSSSPQTNVSRAGEDLLLRVLLAEDNLVNQKVASRQLHKHKHEVTVVGDGLQALQTVKSNHDSFDLVLMDVQMPNMDGLEATQMIREYEFQQGWNRLPILGLTAHAIQGYEETCLKSGMDGYLGKPFDIDQLLRVIDKYVPQKMLSS